MTPRRWCAVTAVAAGSWVFGGVSFIAILTWLLARDFSRSTY